MVSGKLSFDTAIKGAKPAELGRPEVTSNKYSTNL